MCSLALAYSVPAQGYHLDQKTQTVSIVSLADFDRCQRDYDESGSEVCLDALKGYVKKHPGEAFEAGKRARRNFMHWVALDFFATALKTPEHRPLARAEAKATRERCADPDVSAAVISGLSLPAHYPAVALAQKLLRETCWEQLHPIMIEELSGAVSNFQDNTCAQLALRSFDTPQCQARARAAKTSGSSVVARLNAVDVRKLGVEPNSAEALRGPKGEEVLLARTTLSSGGYALVKFKGVRGPFNEQVLVAIERSGGIGKDYVIALDNAEWVVLSERAGQYHAFPKDMPDGFWATPQRPSAKEALKLPTRSEIARELTAATNPGR
jgi:hypothetical protein